MKNIGWKRAALAIVLAGATFASCGGSSSSSSDSRVKNAALETTTTVAASATSCKDGGVCKLGDIGPGGGFVYMITPYVINKVDGVSNGGIYTEFLRLDSNATYNTLKFECSGINLFDTKFDIGSGAQNTKLISERCTEKKSIANKALNATINGQSDWFLPSGDELTGVCNYAHGRPTWDTKATKCETVYKLVNPVANIDLIFYSSSAELEWIDKSSEIIWGQNLTTFNITRLNRSTTTVSPGFVRSFGVGPSAPTTTTTLPPACKDGGVCKLGDIGPGGGTVFYVGTKAVNSYGTTSSGGKYMEFLDPNTKAKFGCTGNSKTDAGDGIGVGARNTSEYMNNCSYKSSAAQLALDATNGGKSDWFLPSLREMMQICRFAHGQDVGDYKECDGTGKLRSDSMPQSVYWSASQYSANSMWAMKFDTGEAIKRDKGDYNYNFLLVRAFG